MEGSSQKGRVREPAYRPETAGLSHRSQSWSSGREQSHRDTWGIHPIEGLSLLGIIDALRCSGFV